MNQKFMPPRRRPPAAEGEVEPLIERRAGLHAGHGLREADHFVESDLAKKTNELIH